MQLFLLLKWILTVTDLMKEQPDRVQNVWIFNGIDGGNEFSF
jgi:hypothetical protein